VSKRSLRHLIRRLSTPLVLAAAAGALAAPSALARPADMSVRHATQSTGVACKDPFFCAAGKPRPLNQVPGQQTGASTTKVEHSFGRSFAWGDAGIGAGVVVLASGTLLAAARLAARRRLQTQA
jgi:hypothetical protein